MFLRFEYGALDREPFEIEDEWFQITYNVIRNSRDEDVAFISDNIWIIVDTGESYSDIVIGC